MRSRRYGLLPTFCGKEPLFIKRCTQFAIIASAGVANFFARAEALTGELRFCGAKWEFLKLPSNFSGESPERSAGDLPSPEKGLARLAYSLASALVYGSLSLTTFFGNGQGLFRWWASFAVPTPWSRLPGVGGLCGTHPLPPPMHSPCRRG